MDFLIRWKAQKLAQRGDQHLSRTRFLLNSRGVQIDRRDQTVIEERLTYASDLRQGLENRTPWAQIKQARSFSKWAEETLRAVEGMLPPDPPILIGPLRRQINS